MSDSLWPHGLYSPWNSPGQNTGVGSLSLLQGIFPTRGVNSGLPHCRRIVYQLSDQETILLYDSIIARGVLKLKVEAESRWEEGSVMWGGLCLSCWPWRWGKGPWSREWGWVLTWRWQGNGFSLRASGRKEPWWFCLHWDPFQISECHKDNTFTLFEATNFVLLYFHSDGKLIHPPRKHSLTLPWTSQPIRLDWEPLLGSQTPPTATIPPWVDVFYCSGYREAWG